MQEYLNFHIDFNDPKTVLAYDEAPLWSAMFGLLLLRYVPMSSSVRALDVGCGTGFPLLELAQRLGPGSIVCGIDPWEKALDRARIKMEMYGVTNVELTAGSADSMPYSDGEFDLIVSNLGINNFENPDAVLAECHRVLKPSGVIALTTNLIGHMKEFYEIFQSTLSEIGNTKALEGLQKNMDHRASIQKLRSLFLRNDFQISKVHEETGFMHFGNGTALLNHHFVKLGFLDGWKGVLEEAEWERTFGILETNLNRFAAAQGALELTIPMAYIEGIRIP